MRTRAFLDSNVFIFAFERPASNSHRIVDVLVDGKLRGVVTDRVVREVMGYFRKHYGKDLAAQFRALLLLTCDLVLEEDLRISRRLRDLVGPKDAGALAAVRALGLARLVSTDRDFEGVPEHRSPRELLLDLGGGPPEGRSEPGAVPRCPSSFRPARPTDGIVVPGPLTEGLLGARRGIGFRSRPDSESSAVALAMKRRSQERHRPIEGFIRDTAHDRPHEGPVDGEELQGTDLTRLWQTTFGHVVGADDHGITSTRQPGRHATHEQVVSVNMHGEGRATLHGREVGEGEGNRDDASGPQGHLPPPSRRRVRSTYTSFQRSSSGLSQRLARLPSEAMRRG